MKKKLRLSKKQIISIVGVVVLIAAAVVVGLVVRSMVVKDNGANDGQQFEGNSLPSKIQDVQNLRNEGNEKESSKKIEDSLNDSSTDRDTRYMLYLQQGHIAYDKKDWAGAEKSYLEAEKIKETAETAELLAIVYVETKENAKAIDYFKKAIRLTPTDNPRYEAIKEGFELRIEKLGSQP